MRERLTRASVVFAVISFACMGCVGPGLEPPGEGNQMSNGGSSGLGGGTGGAGGSSGVGGFGSPGGTGGALDPTGGTGGVGGSAGMAVGGAGGTGVAGGFGGMSGMAGTGGAGGAGGVGGGSGASGDPDAGTEPEAPVLECEQGRDTVMLLQGLFDAVTPSCAVELPDDALLSLEQLALAVTVIAPGSAAETTWPPRNTPGDNCADQDAFYVDNSLGVPQLLLCPALCTTLAELGSEAFKLELIYGCDPPE